MKVSSASRGVRAVDSQRRPPPRKLPPRTAPNIPGVHRHQPPVQYDGSISSEESSDVSPVVQRRSKNKYHVEDDGPIDASLWNIANMEKARRPGSRRNAASLSSADSSERHKNRKKVGNAFRNRTQAPARRPTVSKLPPARKFNAPPPPPSARRRPISSDSSSSDIDLNRLMGRAQDSDSSYDYSSDDSSDMGKGGGHMRIDPLEDETLKAVRKAKLLARIEQMEVKGVKRSKVFNYRTSEEELMVEVARMEVLSERAIRIEQGRAFLMTSVNGVEKGAGHIDRKKWLPFYFNVGGFSKQLHKDIDKYDDCLERGVAETIGPSGSRVWWMDLITVLLPSMVYYSMTNRMTEDPAYANEVMRNNPEFQARIAREVAKELAHTQTEERQGIADELRLARQEIADIRRQQNPSYQPTPQNNLQPTAPVIGRMVPPPMTAIPTTHPLGDFPVDESATREMQQLLAQQQVQKNAATNMRAEINQTVRQEIQGVSQNLREEQLRQASRQQKQMEMDAERDARQERTAERREQARSRPSIRPRAPPASKGKAVPGVRRRLPAPPSKRSAVTLDLGSESEVDSL